MGCFCVRLLFVVIEPRHSHSDTVIDAIKGRDHRDEKTRRSMSHVFNDTLRFIVRTTLISDRLRGDWDRTAE